MSDTLWHCTGYWIRICRGSVVVVAEISALGLSGQLSLSFLRGWQIEYQPRLELRREREASLMARSNFVTPNDMWSASGTSAPINFKTQHFPTFLRQMSDLLSVVKRKFMSLCRRKLSLFGHVCRYDILSKPYSRERLKSVGRRWRPRESGHAKIT